MARGIYRFSSIVKHFFIRKNTFKRIFLSKKELYNFYSEKNRLEMNIFANRIKNTLKKANFLVTNTPFAFAVLKSHISNVTKLLSNQKTASGELKVNPDTAMIKILKRKIKNLINNRNFSKKNSFSVSSEKSFYYKKRILIDNNFLPTNIVNPSPIFPIDSIDLKNYQGVHKAITMSLNSKESKNLLNHIIEKGNYIINQFNYLIVEKQTIINNNKVNNLFLNLWEDKSNEKAVAQTPTSSSPVGAKTNPAHVYPVGDGGARVYSKDNKDNLSPILNKYLKSMSVYNMKKKGILIHYSNLQSYNFVNGSLGYINKIIFKIYKLLQASFKSMFCLISKPLFIVTPDKIIIKLSIDNYKDNYIKYNRNINPL